MSGRPDRAKPEPELTVSEMLSDPIVQKVMDHDGVTRPEVENLIRAARLRMTGRANENRQSGPDRKEINRQHSGDIMSDKDCQCVTCACTAGIEVKATAGLPGVEHNHTRLASVLRYRGLENEAVIAARLCKVESLIWSLKSVLNDLDAAMVAPADCGIEVGAAAEISGHAAPAQDAQAFARRQVRFLERIFESALLRLRTGKSGSGEQTDPRTARHFSSQPHDMNGGPDWGSACAEGR